MRVLPILLFLPPALCACGDAPRNAPPAAASSTLPPGHPGVDGALPAGHPGVAAEGVAELDDPSRFAGRAVLRGALAEASSGTLMVMLRPRGERFPIWAYVVDLADPDAAKQGLAPAENGARVLTFLLSKDTTLMRQAIPDRIELEVAVSYDPDGDVDTKGDQVVGVANAVRGDEALVVELDPGAAK